MAERSFKLEIVTLTKVVYTGEVISIVAPASLGYIGIMANHAPLATDVAVGVLKIKEAERSDEVFMTMSDGFLVVADNEASILVNAAERPEDIDVERARASMERARERLGSRGADVDVARAEAALKRSMTRLKLVDDL